MQPSWWIFVLAGVGIGGAAAFTGLGGGFLIVPLLLWVGFSGSNAVGTSALAILIMIASAALAHHRLGHVDYRVALLIGIGGVVGAQIGAQLVSNIPTDLFRKLFAGILAALSIYLFVKK